MTENAPTASQFLIRLDGYSGRASALFDWRMTSTGVEITLRDALADAAFEALRTAEREAIEKAANLVDQLRRLPDAELADLKTRDGYQASQFAGATARRNACIEISRAIRELIGEGT